jgi:hypothetical protein
MDDELTNRRGLIRGIAMRVATRARDAAAAHSELREQLASLDGPGPAEAASYAPEQPPKFLPAQLTERCVRPEELPALADDYGLAHRRDALLALCRLSVRLGPSASSEPAPSPPVHPWPSWRAAPLPALLSLDLAEVAAVCPRIELPATGSLSVFFATGDSPSGLALDDRGACQVVLGPGSQSDSRIVKPSGELTLPRVWAEPVDALDLSSDEQASWERLRLRLAELQGVHAFDAQSTPRAIHRALGWPDERGGSMPLACALLEEGIELGGQHPATHPRAQELAARAGEWRLLLQLTAEPRLGWVWGGKDRLYIWIRDRDLAVGDFGRVRAFVP